MGKSILTRSIIVIILTFCVTGCSSTKSVVWKAQDFTFSNSKTFEILPVFNATDSPVKQDIIVFLTAQLKNQLAKQNLQVNDISQTQSGVLNVQSDILVYEYVTQSLEGSISFSVKCSLITRLVDKSTKHVVATISTITIVPGKFRGDDLDKFILKKSAQEVAREVAKIMLIKEPEPGIWQNL